MFRGVICREAGEVVPRISGTRETSIQSNVLEVGPKVGQVYKLFFAIKMLLNVDFYRACICEGGLGSRNSVLSLIHI